MGSGTSNHRVLDPKPKGYGKMIRSLTSEHITSPFRVLGTLLHI